MVRYAKFLTYRITFSSFGSKTAFLNVIFTVIRGRDKVYQVCVLVILEPHVLGHQHSSAILPLLLNFRSSIKFFFQHSSDLKNDECDQMLFEAY